MDHKTQPLVQQKYIDGPQNTASYAKKYMNGQQNTAVYAKLCINGPQNTAIYAKKYIDGPHTKHSHLCKQMRKWTTNTQTVVQNVA